MADEALVKPARAIGWSDVATTDAPLVQRCAVGDEEACAELVQEHQQMVYQLALHLLGDHNEALDLSQDVFLRVFRTIHGFRGHSTLRTWIYRIVINQARNRLRWWRRRHRNDQVSLDAQVRAGHEPVAEAATAAPDRVYGQRELSQRLREALTRLPFDQRSVIVLREIDGLSYEEIAFTLSVAVGTVKSRLARARTTLRTDLRDLWDR